MAVTFDRASAGFLRINLVQVKVIQERNHVLHKFTKNGMRRVTIGLLKKSDFLNTLRLIERRRNLVPGERVFLVGVHARIKNPSLIPFFQEE